MRKLIRFILLIIIVGIIIGGVIYNEVGGKYYLVTTDLEYSVLTFKEDDEPYKDYKDFKKTGVKKEVYLKYNDSDKAFAYLGKHEIYKDDSTLLFPKYYAKIKPFSKYGVRTVVDKVKGIFK